MNDWEKLLSVKFELKKLTAEERLERELYTKKLIEYWKKRCIEVAKEEEEFYSKF